MILSIKDAFSVSCKNVIQRHFDSVCTIDGASLIVSIKVPHASLF